MLWLNLHELVRCLDKSSFSSLLESFAIYSSTFLLFILHKFISHSFKAQYFLNLMPRSQGDVVTI